MSSIVTSVLCSVVGLLWNKARDRTAAKLKDGDVTDGKARDMVVRELNEIKTKLDGLSRKDLLSSYSFLQEGVDFLSASVDESKLDRKSLINLNETQDDPNESSRMSSGVESGMLDEVLQLSHAMEKLNVRGNKEFELAIERFKDARKRATDAFCIESLSIQDRILAAKLRIVSEILESLESPETAITGCLSFLKKLHSLSAVRETFAVYLNRGIKSMLSKAERVENIKSLMLINYVLFQYASKFGSGKYSFVLSWPTLELAERSFHPILNWREVSTRKSMGKDLMHHPNGLFLDEVIFPQYSAVNSYWDVAIATCDSIRVRCNTGGIKVVKLPEPKDGKGIDQSIEAIAFDKNNNVYVVRSIKTRMENDDVKSYVLNVMDENYNAIHEYKLHFIEKRFFDMVRIAVNKDDDITMIIDNDPHVYVCDNTGQLKHKFACDSGLLPSLGISGQNEIVRSSRYLNDVHMYTQEGKLKSTIKLPKDHSVRAVAFHYGIRKIIVLTFVEKNCSLFLLCYANTGELETATFLYRHNDDEYFPQITSHPNGPVAIVREQSITFI